MSGNPKNIYNERFEQFVSNNTFVNGGIQSVGFKGDGTVFDTNVQQLNVGDSGVFQPVLLNVAANSVLMGPSSGTGPPTFKSIVSSGGNVTVNAADIHFKGDGVLHSSNTQTITAGTSGTFTETPISVNGPLFFMGPSSGVGPPSFRDPTFAEAQAGWDPTAFNDAVSIAQTGVSIASAVADYFSTIGPLYSEHGFSAGGTELAPNYAVNEAGDIISNGGMNISGPSIIFANIDGFFECMMNAEFTGDFTCTPKLSPSAQAAVDNGTVPAWNAANPNAPHDPDTNQPEPDPSTFKGSAIAPHWTGYANDSQYRVGLKPAGSDQTGGGPGNGPSSILLPTGSSNFGFRHMSDSNPNYYFYNQSKSVNNSTLYAGTNVNVSGAFVGYSSQKCSNILGAAGYEVENDSGDQLVMGIECSSSTTNPKRAFIATSDSGDGLDIIQSNPLKKLKLYNYTSKSGTVIKSNPLTFDGNSFYGNNIFSLVTDSVSSTTVALTYDSTRYQCLNGTVANVYLPLTTSIQVGQSYILMNNQSTTINVYYLTASSVATLLHVLPANQQLEYICIAASTSATDWYHNADAVITGTPSSVVYLNTPPLFTVTGSGTDHLNLGYTSNEALPTTSGGTGVVAPPTTAVASSFTAWDTNKNINANNISYGFNQTNPSDITFDMPRVIKFTGTTATTQFSTASTFTAGQSFEIINQMTGDLQVQYTNNTGAARNLIVIPSGQMNKFVCTSSVGSSQQWKYYTSSTSTTNTVSVAITAPSILHSSTAGNGNVTIDYSGSALPYANGGTNLTALPLIPAPSTYAAWDTQQRMLASTFVSAISKVNMNSTTYQAHDGYAFDTQNYPDCIINVYGSGGQKIALPVSANCVIGQKFYILNDSTTDTVQVGANDIFGTYVNKFTVPPEHSLEITCLGNNNFGPLDYWAPKSDYTTSGQFKVAMDVIDDYSWAGGNTKSSVSITANNVPVINYMKHPTTIEDFNQVFINETHITSAFTIQSYNGGDGDGEFPSEDHRYIAFVLPFEPSTVKVNSSINVNTPIILQTVTVSLQQTSANNSTGPFNKLPQILTGVILPTGSTLGGTGGYVTTKPYLVIGTLHNNGLRVRTSTDDVNYFIVSYLQNNDMWVIDFTYQSV